MKLKQHKRLICYFTKRGFHAVREVGSAPLDLPLRMIWGGAGTLMLGDCEAILSTSSNLWRSSKSLELKSF